MPESLTSDLELEQPETAVENAAPAEDDFFLKPAQQQPNPAPQPPAQKSYPTPAERAAKAAPTDPTPSAQPSHIPEHMLQLAESLSISRDEAHTFGSPEELSRALAFVAKRDKVQRQPTQQQPFPQPQAVQQPTPQPKPGFDPSKFTEKGGWDPEVIEMANQLHELTQVVSNLQKANEHLVAESHNRRGNEGKQVFDGAVKDAGFGHVLKDTGLEQKLLKTVIGLTNTWNQLGDPLPDHKTMVAHAAHMLGIKSQQQPAPAPKPAPRPQPERNGAPTHRRINGLEEGGRLRRTLVDNGYDPGPDVSKDQGYDFFLKPR